MSKHHQSNHNFSLKVNNFSFTNFPIEKLIFYSIMILFSAVGFVNCIITKGEALYDMFVPNYTNHYWDLMTSIYHNYERIPYDRGVIYPPGANILCWIFSRFFSFELYQGGPNAMRDSQIGMLFIVWFITITTLILVSIICWHKNGSALEKTLFIILILCSAPYMREITKMNLVIFSVIFVYLFLIGKDSDNRIIRFLSLLCLACAVSIKIYPVFLGLLLLKEKRWKSVWLCIMIGALVFFLPFLFFGGVEKMLLMLKNIFFTTGKFEEGGFGFRVDIGNTISMFGNLLGLEIGMARSIGNVLNIVILIVSIFSFFFITSKWKSMGLLSLITLSYPPFSHSYGILIMVPSLICLLDANKNTDSFKLTNVIYSILFSLMFAPMFFGGQDVLPQLNGLLRVNLFTLVESIVILMMQIMFIVNGLSHFIKKLSDSKRQNFKVSEEIVI